MEIIIGEEVKLKFKIVEALIGLRWNIHLTILIILQQDQKISAVSGLVQK